MKPRRFGIVLGLALLMPPGPVSGAAPAGVVSQLGGNAIAEVIQADGSRRKIARGDSVFEGERVVTGSGSSVEISFGDESRFHLGPDAEMAVDKFVFRAAKEEEALHTRVLKGAFRFVTGLVAMTRPANVRVNIAVATIGLRGTQILGEVKPRHEKDGRTVDASAQVMLQES
ncbi:MAG: FecR domain-containing protein, partial [Dongiaceae bacterium]